MLQGKHILVCNREYIRVHYRDIDFHRVDNWLTTGLLSSVYRHAEYEQSTIKLLLYIL
jgi:hypothetical protein